jgi:hypothetical protein
VPIRICVLITAPKYRNSLTESCASGVNLDSPRKDKPPGRTHVCHIVLGVIVPRLEVHFSRYANKTMYEIERVQVRVPQAASKYWLIAGAAGGPGGVNTSVSNNGARSFNDKARAGANCATE